MGRPRRRSAQGPASARSRVRVPWRGARAGAAARSRHLRRVRGFHITCVHNTQVRPVFPGRVLKLVDIYLTRVHNMHVLIVDERWRAVVRRAITSIAIILILTVTAGCASVSGEQAPQANGIGPITFAIGSDDITWLTPVISGWNRAHPDQKVTELLLPEASNVQLDQLVANLQAKSPIYDVIDMDVVWTAQFASNGWIIQLSPTQFPLSGFLKPAVQSAIYQGKLWAVPDYSN